jgi:uncharacterized delta-60 repeat protein
VAGFNPLVAALTAAVDEVRTRRARLAGVVLTLLIGLCNAAATAAPSAGPGRLDTSFGTRGKAVTDLGAHDVAQGVAIQPDGMIVVAGSSGTSDSRNFAIVRYTKAGRVDRSFGRRGHVVTDLGDEDTVAAVVLQPDAKIIVAGSTGRRFALVRYTSRGTLDRSFGRSGKVVTDVGQDRYAFDTAIQADGKILVAGGSNSDGAGIVLRYTTRGALDQSFGRRGRVEGDLSAASSLAVQADGKIVAAGWTGGLSHAFELVRYTKRGTLDRSFGDGGSTGIGIGATDEAEAVAVQADGRIVVAGTSVDDTLASKFAVARFRRSGAEDSYAVTDVGRGEFAWALMFQRDGKVVVAGETGPDDSSDLGLVRYTRNLKLDRSFGSRGKVVTDLGGSDSVAALALQTDGKIVAAGRSGSENASDFALVRYLP